MFLLNFSANIHHPVILPFLLIAFIFSIIINFQFNFMMTIQQDMSNILLYLVQSTILSKIDISFPIISM